MVKKRVLFYPKRPWDEMGKNQWVGHNSLFILAPLPEVIKNKPTAEFPDNDQVPHVSSE